MVLKASEEDMWAGFPPHPSCPMWVLFRGDSTASPTPHPQAGQSGGDVPGAASWACRGAQQAVVL